VLGDREQETGTVSVREHGSEEGGAMPVAELATRIREQTASRSG
jgi:threonyl-tRNA synthetase